MKHSVDYLARYVYTLLVVSQFANRMPFDEYLKPIRGSILFISEHVVINFGSCSVSVSQSTCL